MVARLAHRGPDGCGYFRFSPSEGRSELIDGDGRATLLDGPSAPAPNAAGVVLGHRRLAIIDLSSAAAQPMATSDGRYVLVLNGEIYNYVELRAELESKGHRFRSQSDTEVLLAAFAEWGWRCLQRLIGMFAFAILDTHTSRLFLARDHFGMKPLYYCLEPGGDGLAFGSEIGALLELTGLPRRANSRRLYDYLAHGVTDHGDETLFAGIRALPAAHYAVVALQRPGEIQTGRYWTPDLDREAGVTLPQAAARLRELFLESVDLHLRSDVRVGTMLSGGIDSSAIVMAMRHLRGPSLDLHTFSYVGSHGAISEEPWIDLVNRAAAAAPHKVRLEPDEWASDVARLVGSQGEPFGSIAIYAQHRVFRRASEAGIKVVLDGQGADELMGGYRSYWSVRLAGLLARGRLLEAARVLRGIARTRQPFDPTLRSVALRGIALALPPRLAASARRVLGAARQPWIDHAWCRRHGIDPVANHHAHARIVLRRELWHAVSEAGLPALLRYEDRNAMAYSLESRLPFLTPALAEYVLALPDAYLVAADGTGKRVFREAMRGIVPQAVLDRRDKVGFAVPIRSWLPLLPDVPALLAAAARIPAVHAGTVLQYCDELATGRLPPERTAFLIWRLTGLAAWARHFEVTFE